MPEILVDGHPYAHLELKKGIGENPKAQMI